MSKLEKESDLKSDGLIDLAGSSPAVATILTLYPEYNKVYGPYARKDSRRILVLTGPGGRTTRQLAKVILEIKLGRRLVNDETVDHIDGNVLNDSSDNLQVLSLADNIKKSNPVKNIEACCDYCGNTFLLSAAQRSSRAKAKKKFCSRQCRGKVYN